MIGFALTPGHVPPVRDLGLRDDELGVSKLRETSERILGAEDLP